MAASVPDHLPEFPFLLGIKRPAEPGRLLDAFDDISFLVVKIGKR